MVLSLPGGQGMGAGIDSSLSFPHTFCHPVPVPPGTERTCSVAPACHVRALSMQPIKEAGLVKNQVNEESVWASPTLSAFLGDHVGRD